jgi:hypothetical protein
MKKLLNNMIKPFIRSPRSSANRTDSPGGPHSRFTLTTVALICFGLSAAADAQGRRLVLYGGEDLGNGNTAAEYVEALPSLTSGVDNTATGFRSLFNNTTGSNNTATGFQSLLNNRTGTFNIATGDEALASNTAGSFNTAIGSQALFGNTTGADNTATGRLALAANTTGNYNTAHGSGALYSNTSADNNTATGFHALFSNTTGYGNTANGADALTQNTTGVANIADGFRALYSNTTGSYNTASGVGALFVNTVGSQNTAIGTNALLLNLGGNGNTAVGNNALENSTGDSNTAVGWGALEYTTGQNNVALGNLAGGNSTTGSNNIYIGYSMQGAGGESNTCYIGSIWGRTSSGGAAVFINSAGKLGTTTSSRRFKRDIKPMNDASETLFALQPVTFRYKNEIDPDGIPQFGLIAEEVEKVDPDLVVHDKEGKPNTVRYEQINAMLLNEFLKEHKTVEEQQTTIGQLKSEAAQQEQTISALKKGMETLTAQVKEHAAQIQKVSPPLATSRSASRVMQ